MPQSAPTTASTREKWAPAGSFPRKVGQHLEQLSGLVIFVALVLSAIHGRLVPVLIATIATAAMLAASVARSRVVTRADRNLLIVGIIGHWLGFAAFAIAEAIMIFGPIPIAAYLAYFSLISNLAGITLRTVSPAGWGASW